MPPRGGGGDVVTAHGGELVLVSLVAGQSTSSLVAKARS